MVEEWARSVPDAITQDPLWRMKVYRLALYASDLGWQDVTELSRNRHGRDITDQLYRALGSISANIAEGYSRGTPRDRALFYRYALGSARESRDWYYKTRHVLPEQRLVERLDLLSQIIRLLLVIATEESGHVMRESDESYEA